MAQILLATLQVLINLLITYDYQIRVRLFTASHVFIILMYEYTNLSTTSKNLIRLFLKL